MFVIINIGDKFGRLTVKERLKDDITDSGKKYSMFLCLCECGNKKITRGRYLENGYVKSCGCLNNESRKNILHNYKNEYDTIDDIVYVKLSNSNQVMKCDIDIWERAKRYTWNLDDHGYASARVDGKLVRFHRYYFSTDENKIIDHIDRDKLNNTGKNIREVTYTQNNRNVNKRKSNTSGYIGVSYDKRRNKYYSYITLNNKKRKFLGYYDTPIEAFNARMKAEEIYY